MVKLKIQNLLRIIKLKKFQNNMTYDTGNSLLIYFCLHKSKIKVNELNIVLMALYKTGTQKRSTFLPIQDFEISN